MTSELEKATKKLTTDTKESVSGICRINVLVYRITNKYGSGYNRKNGVQFNTKSKIGGAITDAEYCSQETK
ncbi:MAG: hypothetical protein FJ005_06995, partial [Chloroflexi bacterium]|nr:hypothetical protein [Chloroflexota bacterium]